MFFYYSDCYWDCLYVLLGQVNYAFYGSFYANNFLVGFSTTALVDVALAKYGYVGSYKSTTQVNYAEFGQNCHGSLNCGIFSLYSVLMSTTHYDLFGSYTYRVLLILYIV